MDRRGLIESEGFEIFPRVLSSVDFDPIEEELPQVSIQRSRAGVRHALRLKSVQAIAHHSSLAEIARSVLGTGAIPYRATLFDKSRSANWLVVWHQDTALPLCDRAETPGWGPWSVKEGVHYAHAPAWVLSEVLALRVHLDESTSRNGPLRVLPRTHVLGVLNDDQLHDFSRHVEPVDCIVQRGAVLAMRPLLVHASSKSLSNMPRRVLHIEYAASESIAKPLQLAIT